MPSSKSKRNHKERHNSPAALIMSVETMHGRRKYPVTHPAVEAPLCQSCAAYGLCFFDLDCEGCLEVVQGPDVSVAQLFAVLRQWTRPVQIQIETIFEQMFAQGANVNDRDGLTDMTLLHYAAKSGAQGEEGLASRMVSFLLDEGALLEARCKWTDMTPLHYSVYFDVPCAVELLLDRGADIRATCGELCRGGVLHIAAAQLALDSARVLVKRGADRDFRDARGRTPLDCLPSINELPETLITLRNHLSTLLSPTTPPHHYQTNPNKYRPPESGVLAPPKLNRPVYTPIPSLFYTNNAQIVPIDSSPIQEIYEEPQQVELDQQTAALSSPTLPNNEKEQSPSPINTQSQLYSVQHSPGRVSAKVTLQALGMNLGDRVRISNTNTNRSSSSMTDSEEYREGILRYCGPVEFADGVWAGLEVNKGQGKNNGTVDGVRYFSCQFSDGEGVFCPVTRLKPINKSNTGSLNRRPGTPRHALEPRGAAVIVNHGSVDISGVVARVDTGRSNTNTPPQQQIPTNLQIGDRVLVAGQRKGVIRFVGPAEFAPGLWFGIELDKAVGRNDGAVGGVRYFTCPPNKGVFAPQSRLQKLRPRKEVPSTTEGTERAPSDEQRHSTLMTSSQIQDSMTNQNNSNHNNTMDMDQQSEGTNSTSSSRPGSANNTLIRPSNRTKRKQRSNVTSPSPLMTSSAIVSNAPSYFGDASGAVYLREGLQVLCNNELGVIRFIGTTEFAEGVWCGIELRHSSTGGRNDGSVQGKRYFICAPGHGLMVRPSRLTVRGINGAHLIPPELVPLHIKPQKQKNQYKLLLSDRDGVQASPQHT